MPYLNKKTYDLDFRETGAKERPGFFYVDDLLAETIQILNTKGYNTHVCCEGHYWDLGEVWLDIRFFDTVDLPSLPSFEGDDILFKDCRLKYCLGEWVAEDMTIFEFTRKKTDLCEAIYEWADTLPDNPLR